VQIDGELVEITDGVEPTPRNAAANAGVLWNDRIYQDGSDKRFVSRTQHREFMKRTGLTTIDDFKNDWKKGEQKRRDIRAGVDPTRRGHIKEALHKLFNKR